MRRRPPLLALALTALLALPASSGAAILDVRIDTTAAAGRGQDPQDGKSDPGAEIEDSGQHPRVDAAEQELCQRRAGPEESG